MAAPPWTTTPGPPPRPRRTAAERRAQAGRAQARAAQALLRSFRDLGHRGCRPTKLGTALAEALGASAPRTASGGVRGVARASSRAEGDLGNEFRAAAGSGGAARSEDAFEASLAEGMARLRAVAEAAQASADALARAAADDVLAFASTPALGTDPEGDVGSPGVASGTAAPRARRAARATPPQPSPPKMELRAAAAERLRAASEYEAAMKELRAVEKAFADEGLPPPPRP